MRIFLSDVLFDREEGVLKVQYDDSIIQDVAAEKAQDMHEVGVTMHPWEYRMRWYGEDEETVKARARGLGKDSGERNLILK